MKKNIFKKIFIKFSKLLGFEIIDQNRFVSPTLNKELNEELSPLNLPPINVGIGISTGECIVGNMGSEIRFDYSVIGDAVNLGARLESQTRNYDGVDLLLSERTYLQCPERTFKKVDSIKVKGKSEQVTIYTC